MFTNDHKKKVTNPNNIESENKSYKTCKNFTIYDKTSKINYGIYLNNINMFILK